MRGLEFNASAVHLLASGGAEGGLCIWDITNTAAPTEYPALKARCPCSRQPSSSAAPERSVQHCTPLLGSLGLSPFHKGCAELLPPHADAGRLSPSGLLSG